MAFDIPGLPDGIPGLPGGIPGLPDGIPNPFEGLPPLPFDLPDINNLPGPIRDILTAVIGAGLQPQAAGILAAYLAYLEQQASGKLNGLPQPLISWLRPHYSVNLDDVRYAENIDTVHGQAITVENHIYFPTSVNLSDPNGINWLTHELQHCDQYNAKGGKGPFFAQYAVESAAQIIAKRSFNVHDDIGLEQEADAKSSSISSQLKWLLNSRTVALQAGNGQWVSAEGGGGREVVANRNDRFGWETFWMARIPNGKYIFCVSNGQFMCAEAGGGREVVANRNIVGEWEPFDLLDLGGGNVALRASNGQYVSAEGGGGREVVANRDAVAGWETFRLVPV